MLGEYLFHLGGVPMEEFENCLTWAFGELHGHETLEDLRIKWNKRHSNIFEVFPSDSEKMFLAAAGKAYMERNFEKKTRDEIDHKNREKNRQIRNKKNAL